MNQKRKRKNPDRTVWVDFRPTASACRPSPAGEMARGTATGCARRTRTWRGYRVPFARATARWRLASGKVFPMSTRGARGGAEQGGGGRGSPGQGVNGEEGRKAAARRCSEVAEEPGGWGGRSGPRAGGGNGEVRDHLGEEKKGCTGRAHCG
jgi:hypothetical protein